MLALRCANENGPQLWPVSFAQHMDVLPVRKCSDEFA